MNRETKRHEKYTTIEKKKAEDEVEKKKMRTRRVERRGDVDRKNG